MDDHYLNITECEERGSTLKAEAFKPNQMLIYLPVTSLRKNISTEQDAHRFQR